MAEPPVGLQDSFTEVGLCWVAATDPIDELRKWR